MTFPGPSWLGRGLVVGPGGPVPKEWSQVPRCRVDLRDPEASVAILHAAWLGRQPIVVELAVSPAELKSRESCNLAPYTLLPDFEFTQERLHFLVWANNYDGTREEGPIWWHERLAQRLGAKPSDQAEVLVEGCHAWCDGGPRGGLAEAVLHRETIESGQLRLTRPDSSFGATELAPDQLQAVLHPFGPARIIAPAGSGKTRVLTERMRYLLKVRHYEPGRLTALAYNRRAAEEMLQRSEDFEGRPNIKTLHALGFGLVRADRQVRLINEREVREILRNLVKVRQVLGQDPLAAYIEALSEVRLSLREPAEVEKRGGNDLAGFAQMFGAYREHLSERNLVDHDEQIYGALEVLLRRPDLRRKAQLACTHLLVDEFQDLTPAYLLMVRLLAAPGYQVFGVGDDDQVIYGYAGATPSYLVKFASYFPGAAAYALEVNYRCPTGVVEAVDRMLGLNKLRVTKTIRAGPGNPVSPLPEIIRVPTTEWAPRTVRQLQAWLEVTAPQNIAVLSRVKAALLPVQVFMSEAGLPHHPLVDVQVLERTGIRTSLAYLRLARNTGSRGRLQSNDLMEAMRRPSRKLRREVVQEASRRSSFSQLLNYASELDEWAGRQVKEFVNDVKLLAGYLPQGTEAVLRALRTRVGLGEAMAELDGTGQDVAAASHLDDLIALEQLARLHPDPETFEPWVREALERPGDPEGIRLSTVHRVKGMEWDYVLVYGAQNGLFPHRLSEDLEEERRIFHVALTRARQVAVVLADIEQPSDFILEMLPPPEVKVKPKKTKKTVNGRTADPDRVAAFAGALGVSKIDLTAALKLLQDNERWVFQWRYGLVDGTRHENKIIAATLGKTTSATNTWQQLAEKEIKTRLARKVDFEAAFRALTPQPRA